MTIGYVFSRAWEIVCNPTPYCWDIILTTLKMVFTSSILAFLIGVPIGLLIASSSFKGKSIVVVILRTLMGLPPVVIGITVYVLFCAIGPFGNMHLVFTVTIMIIAQVILITPIVAGMTESSYSPIISKFKPTLKGLNISPFKSFGICVIEGKYQLIAVYLFAFARAISEVGAVQIVGGNILGKTRVMTTAIALNYSAGEFSDAIALGIILLIISLIVNLIAGIIQISAIYKRKK